MNITNKNIPVITEYISNLKPYNLHLLDLYCSNNYNSIFDNYYKVSCIAYGLLRNNYNDLWKQLDKQVRTGYKRTGKKLFNEIIKLIK